MRHINQAGLELIESFEGLRLKAYTDSVGIWTIGYGHTGPEVVKGLEISRDQAEDLLRNDLGTAERGVEAALGDVGNSNQFSACVSLAFNVGVHAFAGSSIVKLMKAGDMFGAADRFMQWNKAGGQVVKGLTRRREAERKLFLTPDIDEDDTDTQPLTIDPPPDEPPAPDEIVTETKQTITETPTKTETVTEQKSSFIGDLGLQDAVKDIAKSGVTKIGTSTATALGAGGIVASVKAFIANNHDELVFAGYLILLAVAVVAIVLISKHFIKKRVIDVNADKTKNDVRLL